MEPGITVHLDEVGALAAQLSALAGELHDGARTCRGAADDLRGALGLLDGWRASAVATAWGALAEHVAERTGAIAATLAAAAASYAAADADLASGLAAGDGRGGR